ncbi:MAG: peroxiredoxin family protein [Candidatus Zixiibacteriota bacterium]
MKNIIMVLVLVLVSINIATAEEIVFKVGDQVPDFKLPYATKDSIGSEELTTAGLKGTRYLLAFYPADWSGGCTKEVCTFRDSFDDLKKLDIEIIAVSGDYVYSHFEWAKHHNLPFKLAGDHTREFGQKMGVYMPEHGMHKRSVFVVGKDGRFEYIDAEYSVKDNADFEALKAALAAK